MLFKWSFLLLVIDSFCVCVSNFCVLRGKQQLTNPKLYIYSAPSYDAEIVGTITDMGVYTIVEEYLEPGQTSIACTWGRLKSGAGWINMYDATLVDEPYY